MDERDEIHHMQPHTPHTQTATAHTSNHHSTAVISCVVGSCPLTTLNQLLGMEVPVVLREMPCMEVDT